MSGLTSADKVYDGTDTAVVSGTAALLGAITAGSGTSSDGKSYSVDSVSLTGTAAGLFSSKDVGTRTVSFSGKSLTGTGFGNYTLTQQGADTGKSITAKALTMSGLTSADKVYDGTDTAGMGWLAMFIINYIKSSSVITGINQERISFSEP
jgi:type IV secretory pathway TrbL component